MPYIYSTLSADNQYPLYEKTIAPGQPHTIKTSVIIRGGTGVINAFGKTAGFSEQFVQPEEYAILQENSVFKLHVANGFIMVTDKRIGDDTKVEKELRADDGGKQLTAAEIETGSARIPLRKKKDIG